MERRDFVVGLGAAGLTSLSGCTAISPETRELDSPRIEKNEDGSAELYFVNEGNLVSTVKMESGQRWYGSEGDQVPVSVSYEVRDNLNLKNLRMNLRVPYSGEGFPARFALMAPGWSPRPEIDIYRNPRDSGMLLEIPNWPGEAGEKLDMEFLVTRLEDYVDEVILDVDMTLKKKGLRGGKYKLEGLTRVSIPSRVYSTGSGNSSASTNSTGTVNGSSSTNSTGSGNSSASTNST
ncbi:MAG: hypothetical protein ABEK59_12625 [Halobacteria archaeon]